MSGMPSGFQLALIIVFAALFLLSLLLSARRWRASREIYLWTLLWGIGMIVSIEPDITTVVARALGIGRGADLVFYCAIVVMMVGFLMVYMRLRRLRRDVTLMVRHIAMLEDELQATGRAPAIDTKETT